MIYLLWIIMITIAYRIGLGDGRVQGFNRYADATNKKLEQAGIDFRVERLESE